MTDIVDTHEVLRMIGISRATFWRYRQTGGPFSGLTEIRLTPNARPKFYRSEILEAVRRQALAPEEVGWAKALGQFAARGFMLSTRAQGALKALRVHDVESLARLTGRRLDGLRNCGEVTRRELLAARDRAAEMLESVG